MDDYVLDERAEQEIRLCLKENEQSRRDGLAHIREWLLTEPNLNAKTDDFNLIRFLRACKYDLEHAKRKLKNYYRLRGTVPQWFSDRNPRLPELQELLNIGVFIPLLKRDQGGRLVVIIRIAAHDPSRHKQDDVFKIGNMVLDWVLNSCEDTTVFGVCAIFDMLGVSFAHSRQLTVTMIRNAVHSWQDCYPVRVKSLDFVNSPAHVNIVLKIFKQFMRPKLRERVHVHGYNLESLHKNISKDILPIEYGGTEGSLKTLKEYWQETITDAQSWYEEDEKYKMLSYKS